MVATDIDRVRRVLSAADFPADKWELVRYAERADADADTIRALRAMPPVSYANVNEVVQSVSLEADQPAAEQAPRRRAHAKPGLAAAEKDIGEHGPVVDELGENRGS